MTIIATCGHELQSTDDLIPTSIKDVDREIDRVVSIVVLCSDCYDFYEKDGRILFTKEEENKWLGGDKCD